MRRGRILLVLLLCGVMFAMFGCMKGERSLEDVNVPEDISVVDDTKDNQSEEDVKEEELPETEEKVARDIYLIDENGLVVPQALELPKTESAAMQVMEYMVKDGPVTELLPNGFQAVLPPGTEILGVNLDEEGVITIDLSEDFKNYEAEDEVKILQAMTHTLTQFDSIEAIKIWVNGENQEVMPVNGTPISDGYSRANGINLDIKEKPDVQHSEPVTMFYPKEYQEGIQFVPVTTLVNSEKTDIFTAMMESLIDGPSSQLKVEQVFNDDIELEEVPKLVDGILQLDFNGAILKDQEKGIIADDVMAAIVKTLTTQEEVEAVSVKVKDIPTIHSENGHAYDEPVSVQDVTGKEKM